MKAEDTSPAPLSQSALRAELSRLPGWVTARSGKALRRAWQFPDRESACRFAFAFLAVSFERDLFADWSLAGPSLGVLVSDPSADSVTERVVDLAQRLSQLSGDEPCERRALEDTLSRLALFVAAELSPESRSTTARS